MTRDQVKPWQRWRSGAIVLFVVMLLAGLSLQGCVGTDRGMRNTGRLGEANRIRPYGSAPDRSHSIGGLAIGDTETKLVMELWGQPVRKDQSEFGYQWYVYNQDYSKYFQAGVRDGRIVALYTSSDNWNTNRGIGPGSTLSQVEDSYKNTTALSTRPGDEAVYELSDIRVTYYIDQTNNQRIQGVLLQDLSILEKSTGPDTGITGEGLRYNNDVRGGFERQVFDVTNAFRVRQGKKPFVWDEAAAASAREHSQDMASQGYFDHVNPQGKSPADRMKDMGIRYSYAAENISAGHTNAFEAVNGWVNSSGHRENILGDAQRLGVGVAFGGSMKFYYTQNFFTPQ